MRLFFRAAHKSVDSFPELVLPNFTVITGLNGSGKTHFLEAIDIGHIVVEGASAKAKRPEIGFYNWNTLVPNDVSPIDPQELVSKRNQLWEMIRPAIEKEMAHVQHVINKLPIAPVLRDDLHSLFDMSVEKLEPFVDDRSKLPKSNLPLLFLYTRLGYTKGR